METYHSDLPKIEELVRLENKRLLEVGCGDGNLTALLAHRTQEITAIDPDKSSIDAARSKVPGVNFLVGSGENLDFTGNSFDIILFSYSLHHQNYVDAMAEAWRVVRHDGRILIIEPNHKGEFNRLVSIFEPQETPLLKKTFEFITSGSFQILRQDTYGVAHSFANEDELYDYFIMKFSVEADDRAVRKMQEIIGTKREDSPIIIQDVVNIFLLGSEGGIPF